MHKEVNVRSLASVPVQMRWPNECLISPCVDANDGVFCIDNDGHKKGPRLKVRLTPITDCTPLFVVFRIFCRLLGN